MCKRTSGLSVPIHEWLRESDEWRHRILRKCKECDKFVIQEVMTVDSDYPFCMQCLSHDVKVDISATTLSYICNKCKHVTTILDSPTEVKTDD